MIRYTYTHTLSIYKHVCILWVWVYANLKLALITISGALHITVSYSQQPFIPLPPVHCMGAHFFALLPKAPLTPRAKLGYFFNIRIYKSNGKLAKRSKMIEICKGSGRKNFCSNKSREVQTEFIWIYFQEAHVSLGDGSPPLNPSVPWYVF